MDDAQLTKLAVEELIKEGQKFVKRRELTYTFEEPTRMRPNLRYFRNTLDNCLSSNNRVERVRKSCAAKKMQNLRKEKTCKNVRETHQTRKSYRKTCEERIENKKDTNKNNTTSGDKRKQSNSEKGDSGLDKNCFPSTSREEFKQKRRPYTKT